MFLFLLRGVLDWEVLHLSHASMGPTDDFPGIQMSLLSITGTVGLTSQCPASQVGPELVSISEDIGVMFVFVGSSDSGSGEHNP